MDWTIGLLDRWTIGPIFGLFFGPIFGPFFGPFFFLPILILKSSCYILRQGWLPILIFQEGGWLVQ